MPTLQCRSRAILHKWRCPISNGHAKQWLRKQFYIDIRVQGALIVRVVLYWLTCLVAMMLLLFAWGLITVPNRPMNAHI